MRKQFAHIICLAIFAGMLSASCKYSTDIAHPEKYISVYMPQAVKNPMEYSFTMSDTLQTIIYGANYGGPGYPQKDITVKFKIDTTLADSFNLRNGTDYMPMPVGSYKLGKASAIIPEGKLTTDPLTLSIKTIGALEPSKEYLLPIRIIQAGSDSISGALGTTYYLVKATYEIINIFMSQSGNKPVAYSFAITDTAQTITFDAQYDGMDPGNDVAIYFRVDTTLTQAFNVANGTSYNSMPPGSYDLLQSRSNIPEGESSTGPLAIKVNTKGYLVPSEKYLLPVKIDSVGGDLSVSKQLVIKKGKDVTYFLIKVN
jgi:hypothetical protein